MAAPSVIGSIRSGGQIANPALLTGAMRSYDELLSAYDPVWFTPKREFVTLVDTTADADTAIDEVSVMASRRSGSSATLAAQASPIQAPHFIESDPMFGGRSSVAHDNGGSGDALLYSGAAPVAGDWTKIQFFYLAALPPSGAYYFLRSEPATGARHMSSVTPTQFIHRVGVSGSDAVSPMTAVAGVSCLWNAWDATAKSVGTSRNLGKTWTAPVANAAATCTETALTIGLGANMRWREAMMFPFDLRKVENGKLALLLARYFREIYGYVG